MNRCFSTLQDVVSVGEPCVLVTVAHIAGSAPREPGARMIVTPAQVMGTIGGGNLEFEAMRIARERLAGATDTGAQRHIELFPLGPMLQQCCGGAVFLHFEVVRDAQTGWLRAAAENEQNNTRALLVSHTSPSSYPRRIEQNNARALPVSHTSSSSFPRGRESSKTPPAESGHYPGKMIFTETGAAGSLGDKRLDELAARKADELLSADGVPGSLLHPLAETQSTLPDASDALFLETISPCDFRIALFGAGHVGSALVRVLAASAECGITWLDSRAGQFPGNLPPNVEARSGDPVAEAENLPEQAYCLVMTHDHQLDQDLCEALLRRNDFAFLGLIGSATKRRRFAQRLSEKGISDRQLERLTCPIGIPGIESKEPGVIAISVAAQLLKILSADDADLRR